ncbi:MAG: LamG domain-containing protein [Pirellulales bacterium]
MMIIRRKCLVATCLLAALFSQLCSTAQAQLRGHWRLQETAGTTAVDTSSFGNNGTYTNSPALATSTAVPADGAISAKFDGNNDYVAIPNESNFDFTGAMSVACWIKVDTFDVDSQAIVTKGNSAWRLTRSGTTNFLRFSCSGLSTNSVASTVSVNDGQWHHVAGVYTGSQLRIYIDGALNNSVNSSGSISTNSSTVDIGRNSGSSGREFDGAIYNVVIYNGALDLASIQAMYGWDALVAHWKLNQTSGTVATDSSLTANNGTYTNGVTLAAAGPYSGLGDKAANFDGNNDYVATANDYFYDLAGPTSVAAWIKVDSFTKTWQAIVTKGDSAWRLQRYSNTDRLTFDVTGLSVTGVDSVSTVNDGAWHHVVGVYTGSQLQIYIDGVLDNAVAATGVISRNNFNVEIGRNAEQSGREFDGQIHDVRIYSVALSAAQVSQIYGFIGNWNLAETSGTTAADSSPFAANGAVNGGANWTTRCNGAGAFDFNGTSQYISIPNASHLQPGQMLSVAAWIKPDSFGAGSEVDTILRKGEDNPNNYQLALADGKVALHLDENDDDGTRSTTTLSAGQWYHVIGTWDGVTARVYVNGLLETSAARSGTIGTDTRPLYIGGRSGTDLFDGQIQDVRLYNRPLTNAEIANFSGTAGFWKFDEGSGTTAADSSLNANPATLTGATWTTDCAGYTAIQFNGTGGVAATNSAFTPPDEGTVAFWMRSSGNPASVARLFGNGGDWEVRQGTDGKLTFDFCADGGTTITSATALNESGRWYHVASSYNSADNSYAIYIDGKLELSGTNTNNLVQQPAAVLSFGTRTGSTEYWQGAMRDFRVYSRRLCPGEIAELFGLVGYWALDESSGSSASDSSGAGNNGTVSGTSNWNAGKINNAFQFNGSTSINVSGLLGRPKNVTLSAWAKLTTADSSGSEIISLGDSFAIRLDNGGSAQVFFYNGSSWSTISYNQAYAGGGWHHFAAVFDDDHNYYRLYIDGVQRANGSTTSSITYGLGANTVIGRHGNGQTSMDFTGWIDDARVYNRPLCATEVQRLFNGSAPVGVKIIKWVEIQ